MNMKQLNSIKNKNKTAQLVIDFLAKRQRNTAYTSLAGLRSILKVKHQTAIDRNEFDDVFNSLEKIGAGKIKKSPRNKHQGFYWDVPISSISSILKQKDEENIKPTVPFTSSDASPRTTVIILRRGKHPEAIELEADDKQTEKIIHELNL